jgi:transposase
VFEGLIVNRAEGIRKWVQTISRRHCEIEVTYEAGPTGFVLYRQLEQLGITCVVAAPSLISRPAA